MQWDDIDLARYIVAGAPFGGPVGTRCLPVLTIRLAVANVVAHPAQIERLQSSVSIVSRTLLVCLNSIGPMCCLVREM